MGVEHALISFALLIIAHGVGSHNNFEAEAADIGARPWFLQVCGFSPYMGSAKMTCS
jgi:hypothetical protein